MAYGPVNVPGASEAEVAAVEQAANDAKNVAQGVSDKVGATGDTGGSATAGTVMAKLNKLISDLTTHMGRWTAARAGYIDTINTNAKNSADRIGTTGDTGGSTAAGTVMGKLNKLISDIATHAASWTSTRAGYIDTIKGTTDAIKTSADRIGAANDTGGSTTAGSVMGKLNKLISDITTHMGRWTAARAGYIDVINTNAEAAKTDAAAAKTNTAVNNTANATGTLSQKLSHVISLLTSGDVGSKLDEIAVKGVVKSVQRGICSTFADMSPMQYSEVVYIGTIDPEKSIVLLHSNSEGEAVLMELTESSMIIGAPSRVIKLSWQVIEFY